MAYTSLSYMLKLMDQQEIQYWRVTDSTNRLTINKNDKDIGVNASKELIKETIENCDGDYVNVKLYVTKPVWKQKDDETGTIYQLKIKLQNDTIAPALKQNNNHITGFPSFNDIIALHQANANLQMEMKLKELENKATGNNKLLEYFTSNKEFMSAITGLIFSMTKKGVPATIRQPDKAQQQQAIINAPAELKTTLKEFAEIDPDYINTLKDMASYLKQSPESLEQIKTILSYGKK